MPEGGNGGPPTYGYLDQERARRCACELGSPEPADRALAGHSPSYRSLDTAVLEKLVLEDALGLTEDDISHQRGLAYARDLDQALRAARHAASTSSRSCCARRRSSRCRRWPQAGETMPPKSTYFYPKLLSGLLFNPLWD